jgi:hypothetical protein
MRVPDRRSADPQVGGRRQRQILGQHPQPYMAIAGRVVVVSELNAPVHREMLASCRDDHLGTQPLDAEGGDEFLQPGGGVLDVLR